MKKSVLFSFLLFLAFWQTANAGQDSDTVWTKNIWPEEVGHVLFSSDGSKVFVSTTATVRVYDTMTGDSLRTVPGFGDFMFYSPDKMFIFTGGLRKLDASTYQMLAIYDTLGTKKFDLSDVSLTGDGRYIIATSRALQGNPDFWHDNVAIFNTINMKFIKMLSFPEMISNISSSSDGKYFVTSSTNFDPVASKTYNYSLVLWDAQKLEKIKIIFQDSLPVNTIKFTPDSKYLAVAIGGQVWFYETINFTVSKKFGDYTTAMSFTDDSKYMITGKTNDLKIYVWDIENKKLIKNLLGKGGKSGIDINQVKKYIISGYGWFLSLLNSKFDTWAISDNTNGKETFIIYPNPINGIANISFKNILPGNYEINIYDNSGIKIFQLFNGFLEPENHEFKWNTVPYPNGTYFCRIIGNGVNLTYKIIIAK